MINTSFVRPRHAQPYRPQYISAWVKYNGKVITLTVTLYNYKSEDVSVPLDTGVALNGSSENVTLQLIFSCVKTRTEDVHVDIVERVPHTTDLH